MKKKILLLVLSILAISQLTYSASDPRIERLLKIAKQTTIKIKHPIKNFLFPILINKLEVISFLH